MFKFGVYSVKQLKNGNTQTFFGAEKNVSVTLLDDIRKNDLSSKAYASVMFKLNDDRGTYKRTHYSRFDDFDNRCIEIISKTLSTPDMRIHDVAVSSGETAVDFYGKLQSQYPSLSYFATDYDPYLTVINQYALTISVTSNGSVIEMMLPPFVFTPKRPDHAVYPINRLLCSLLLNTWAKWLQSRYKKEMLPLSSVQKVDLFCPEARTLANEDSHFRLGRYDILSSTDKVFNCIRAMNVLNNNNFSEADFKSVLANFHKSIEKNGFLIVGSNYDPGSPVAGAVYARSERTFDLIWSSEMRPSVDKHVDAFNQRGA